MPPVVVAVISIGVTYAATAGLITATTAALISVGLLVASVAYADSEATKARREARDKYNAAQVDRLQNISSTVAARELVLGRVRKGGTVIFRDSCGAHNSKFVMVIALAGHEIDGVEKFFLNEKEVTVDSQGYVTTEPYSLRRTESWFEGQAPAGAELVSGSCYSYYEGNGDNDSYVGEMCQYYVYDNYARIRVINGAQTTADARLMELFPGVWTADHKLLGVAYAILEFDFNETAFPNGLPNFTCQLRGAKVYDPRTGTTAFSRNPALHARHIALHPRFGKRTVLSAREDARIVAAANACDTPYTPAGGTAGALYTSDIVIPFGSRAADALDDLCQAMCGMWGYAGGEFFLKAGVYTAPVKALQASDLLTLQTDSQGGSNSYPIQITTHKARADKINSVTAKIYDAGKNYQENTTTPVENADAIAKDGQRLPLEINLAAVSTASQAQVICNYMLKDSFDPLMIVASFKLSTYDIELFDNVSLTIPRYGWNAKVFKVFGRKFNPSGSIELTLKETSAQLYNPEIYSDSNGFTVNTNLVEPWEIDDPGVLTMSSGTSDLLLQGDGTVVTRVRVQWAEILDARIRQGGQVEVWWRPNNALNWTAITVPGVESSTYILGANDGSTIVVKARTRTALAVSDWNVQATHLVLGKTEPPGNVTGLAVSLGNQSLNLTWNKVPDVDLAGYEVRSSDSGWGTGNEIYRGNATSIGVEPTGTTTTWYVRAFDKSGNYSLATASTSYTVSAVAQVSNISHVFADTSLTSATVTISWVDAQPTFGLAYYEVAYLAEVITVRSNTITLPAGWIGDRNFSITTVDVFGFKSAPANYPITKLRPASALDFRVEVIDNYVLLYWTLPEKTSLPIAHCLIKKGESWETAETVGIKAGEFTTIFELMGGNYRYWISVVDTDGYESDPVSLLVSVNEPPDFLFLAEKTSNFENPLFYKSDTTLFYSSDTTRFYSTGVWTSLNATLDGYSLLLPVNTAETFSEHFTNNAWTSPNSQVSAGFPIYAQPGTYQGTLSIPSYLPQTATAYGYYEEVFDFDTVVGSSGVTVTVDGSDLTTPSTKYVTIGVSNNGVDWTYYYNTSKIYSTNFRYVKVKLEVAQTVAGQLYKLNQVSVRLESRQLSDSGSIYANASDVGGTVANLNIELLDVGSITTTALATQPRQVVYDFLDANKTGTYSISSSTMQVTVTGHGLKAGQKVRIYPTSGTLVGGVYTVVSVVNVNTYTVTLGDTSLSGTSGACVTYPNSFTVYVYDNAGNRQSGVVSWNVRGS